MYDLSDFYKGNRTFWDFGDLRDFGDFRISPKSGLSPKHLKDAYLDIRFILKPFEEILPLQLKRIFNVSTMDQYTMFIASRWFESIEDHINLMMSTKRFQLNITKFHYNPISINKRTREYFDHLKTLYLYSSKDERFEDDERIIKRESIYVISKYKFLEEWTGLHCDEIVFDSFIDGSVQNIQLFIYDIFEMNKLVFVIEDEDGEIFGYYCNRDINNDKQLQPTYSESFHFNLESNGRLDKPMKFEIKNLEKGGIGLRGKSEEGLIELGDIILRKENNKNESCCCQYENFFNYHGIKNALCGKTRYYDNEWKGERFTSKRILVIQLK